MFKEEFRGLKAISDTKTMKTPEVIQVEENTSTQWIILEWIDKGESTNKVWDKFGSMLAEMHYVSQPYFGFEENNYIGTLQQLNTRTYDWEEFYIQHRLIPLIKKLKNIHLFSRTDLLSMEYFYKKMGEIFPKEKPALIHGDLWNGNYLISKKGEPILIDPAVYYGHREMDIGMSKLFGGFSSRFYESYNEKYPLEKGWEERLPFSQLYPILVHAVLFGGNYITKAKKIIKKF